VRPAHSTPCTLCSYAIHHTLYTIHTVFVRYTPHAVHYTHCTRTLYTIHYTPYTIHFAHTLSAGAVQHTLCTLLIHYLQVQYSIHNALYSYTIYRCSTAYTMHSTHTLSTGAVQHTLCTLLIHYALCSYTICRYNRSVPMYTLYTIDFAHTLSAGTIDLYQCIHCTP
jgi:hypothetical protein